MDEIGGSGPPPIRNGTGKIHLGIEEPYRLVNLDAAVFDWLWRIAEAKYVQHQGNLTHAEAAEVAKRAVIAFREAAGTLGPVSPLPSKRRRRLVKTPNPR
jgi:hypothetical protein